MQSASTFNNAIEAPSQSRILAALLAITLLLYAWQAWLMFSRIGEIAIGPDAWALIEVARGIQLSRFPAIDTVRQFKDFNTAFLNTAYPPLTPMLLALHGTDGHWAAAITAQSTLFALLFPLPIFIAFRRMLGSVEAGLVAVTATLALLSFDPYQVDIATNGTISLSVLLLGSAFTLLLTREIDLRWSALIGLLVALACLNRVDGYPAAVVMFAAIGVMRRHRPVIAASYLIGLTITLLPWLIFSKLYFGSFLVSDNRYVAHSISDHILRLHNTPAHGVGELIRAKLHNTYAFLLNLLRDLWQTKSVLVLAAAALAAIRLSTRQLALDRQFWVLLAGGICTIGGIVTGYVWATRYATPLIAASAIIGATALIGFQRRGGKQGNFAAILLLVCIALVVPHLAYRMLTPPDERLSAISPARTAAAEKGLQPREIIFARLPGNPRIFFATPRFSKNGATAAYFETFRIGALGRIHAIPQPYDWSTLSRAEQLRFFSSFRVTMVAGPCPAGRAPDYVLSLSQLSGCIQPIQAWLRAGGGSDAGRA